MCALTYHLETDTMPLLLWVLGLVAYLIAFALVAHWFAGKVH